MPAPRDASKTVTIHRLQELKREDTPIVALTAYDYLFAKLVDQAGVDVILVGDSLGQVVLGLDTTLPVTLAQMIHHARAVRRGVEHALMVVDMPFLSYQVSRRQALRNAGRVLKETGAEAVKVEGGDEATAAAVADLVRVGIPVMGHVGFTPQSVHALGGYRVQGKGEQARRVVEGARRLEEAGCFSVVLELVPGPVAAEATLAVSIPTIGIGAGPGCDGQVLVLPDMLGLNPDFAPKFLRRFARVGEAVSEGVRAYAEAVRGRGYPAAEHTFE
ncbi:MAG: 3-methyl-2-oxobutanoate hydroxymethyltransferase [Longimicrobiaceae bacterium]